jgi:hypothetical protein
MNSDIILILIHNLQKEVLELQNQNAQLHAALEQQTKKDPKED